MDFVTKILKSPRKTPALIVFASIAILASALGSQYVGGLDPCKLCIYQRIPYVVTIALGLLAYGTSRMSRKTAAAFLMLCALTFWTGAGIAGFHVGVEQEWWKWESECTSGGLPAADVPVEELMKFIENAPMTKCDEVQWSLFGISMAGYNFLLSLGLGGLAFISSIAVFRRPKKDRTDDGTKEDGQAKGENAEEKAGESEAEESGGQKESPEKDGGKGPAQD